MMEFDGHPETRYQSGLGYFAELMMAYNFNNNLGLQCGINYNFVLLRILISIAVAIVKLESGSLCEVIRHGVSVRVF